MNPFASNQGLRIVIVEDHSMMREVFNKACIEFGHQVVGAVGTGTAAIATIIVQRPELIVLDLALPDLDGFEVIETIRRHGCHPRVLAVSSHCDTNTVLRVEEAEFDGFIDKQVAMLNDLRDALVAISLGRRYFSATFAAVRQERHNDPEAFDKILSLRQQELLSLMGELHPDDEIAELMEISTATVEKHRFRILHCLDLNTRNDLVRYARQQGLVKLSQRELSRIAGQNPSASDTSAPQPNEDKPCRTECTASEIASMPDNEQMISQDISCLPPF